MLDLYFIRHAESEGNVNNHLIGGQSNHFNLTERGETQAHALGKRLKEEGFRFDAVFASIAVRATDTALIAGKHVGFTEEDIVFSEELVELSQGEWEGKVRAEYYNETRFEAINKEPFTFTPPGGESAEDVEKRAYGFIEKHILPFAEKDACVGVFTHGFTMKVLLRKIMGGDPSMMYHTVVHNTALSHFQYTKGQWRIVSHNDYHHLLGTGYVPHYG